MKRSLKHILAASTLLFAGISTSLFADLSDTISDLLRGKGDRYQTCQNVGKYGRALALVPQATKKDLLESCEYELLGISRTTSSNDIKSLHDGITEGKIHPKAWKAIANLKGKPYEGYDAETAADERRRELKTERAEKKQKYQQKTAQAPTPPPAPSAPKIKFPPLPQ